MIFLFRRKRKREEKHVEKTEEVRDRLKELCGDDKELYEDLTRSLYLNQEMARNAIASELGCQKITSEKVMEIAKKYENQNPLKARVYYEHAGSLALYEGNIQVVKKAFKKVAELSGREYLGIMKNPEKAIKIAKMYYSKEPLSN